MGTSLRWASSTLVELFPNPVFSQTSLQNLASFQCLTLGHSQYGPGGLGLHNAAHYAGKNCPPYSCAPPWLMINNDCLWYTILNSLWVSMNGFFGAGDSARTVPGPVCQCWQEDGCKSQICRNHPHCLRQVVIHRYCVLGYVWNSMINCVIGKKWKRTWSSPIMRVGGS